MKKIYLTLFTLLLACLSACSENIEETPSDLSAYDGYGTEDVTTITFASADGCVYDLIRSDTRSDTEELDASQHIYKAIQEKYGKKVSFGTDFVKPGEEPDAVADGEILVGLTNRSASQEAYAALSEHEFTIQVRGNDLVVIGYTPVLTEFAAEVLIENYMTDEGLFLPSDFMEFYKAEPTCTYTTFRNPVAPSGADPWVIRDDETGKYYYCYSGGNGVCVNEIESLDKITSEGGTKVYTAPQGTMYSTEYWAPELHKIDGKWYIYVAADDGDNYNHRMYVLECTGDVPTDSFIMKGKISDSTDKWAIDGTVLQLNGECYFIWSGWDGDENVAQNIYIAHMSDPWTIDSERTLLSKPSEKWEKMGGRPWINEGPAVLVKDGTVHIIYSGSGSWSDFYCLGKLTYRGGDILDAASWTKSEKSIFEKTEKVFGPGHCSFTTAPDGSTWIVYHANLVSGSGWGGRSVWIQPVTWDGDEPVLGSPIDADTEQQIPSFYYSKDNIIKK